MRTGLRVQNLVRQDANPVTYLPPSPGLLSCVGQKRRRLTCQADFALDFGLFVVELLSRSTKRCPVSFKSGFLCFSMSSCSVFLHFSRIRTVALRRSRMSFSTCLCLAEDANSTRGGRPNRQSVDSYTPLGLISVPPVRALLGMV